MNTLTAPPGDTHNIPPKPRDLDVGELRRLQQRIDSETQCEILFSRFDRGRYATDASHYQMCPLGVVVPKTIDDLQALISIAHDSEICLTGRGGGTSQNGQTINRSLIIDYSKYLNQLVHLDANQRRCIVQPGIVLDHLNAKLRSTGLWYPVDVSTSSRATLGGMTGNNSCGSRSIRYGTMRDNVESVRALLADGSTAHWRELSTDEQQRSPAELETRTDLLGRLLHLGASNKSLIESRLPQLMRRVGGYNIDALIPDGNGGSGCWPGTKSNPAHLFVGSEGTLGLFEEIELKLSPIPTNKTLGVCHFKTFYAAMDAAQHLVTLGPSAVELVDRTMIDLSRDIPMFAKTVDLFVKGQPDALLLVEFSEEDQLENIRRLNQLEQMMSDLGQPDAVVRAEDPAFQKQIWEVRKQGLNIMMSMRGDAKPISIVEDCAVDLKDLAEYTRRLTEVFARHGTSGCWYAHASVGTLHVRPVLNLKKQLGADALRAVAEDAFAMVREYKGSHSGEHGDGIARSEFHRDMFGSEMVALFEDVKAMVDPKGLFNPNKIVHPPKHDDRTLFRFSPEYEDRVSIHGSFKTGFDWSAWGSFSGAIEMCNNNGACRKTDVGVMCPSYRVTKNERDLVRGRANTLRLALSGQLGPNAVTSNEMLETMKLCVGCKACQNECPTSVDMAKMKTEVLYQRTQRFGIGLREKLIAYMPHYSPWLKKVPWLANLRDQIPGLPWVTEKVIGLSKDRRLPVWEGKYQEPTKEPQTDRPTVILFGDTFNRSFETKNLYAARQVLEAMGYEVIEPKPDNRSVCCGRTFLAAGLVDQAKREAARFIETVMPWIRQGISVVGLEPSCLLTLRDEFQVLLPSDDATLLAKNAFLFEEFIEQALQAEDIVLNLQPAKCSEVLVHGHCHQKAARAMGPVESLLRRIPGLKVSMIESSCCGMAGHFGYQAETAKESIAMAELDLLPAVRSASSTVRIIADGTSCRHQITDNTARQAEHVAVLLAEHLRKD